MKIIGDKLHTARLLRGWSISELAQKSGISAIAISRYEDEIIEPDGETVFTLACVLQFPIKFFTIPFKDKLVVKNTFF